MAGALFATASLAALCYFDILEKPMIWIWDHRRGWADEILATVLLLVPVISIFAWRRWAEQKAIKDALWKLRDELEQRVGARTAELQRANEALEREIAERERAEKMARDSSNFNRALLEASSVGIIAYAPEGKVLLANEAAARMVGASRSELLAQNFRELRSWKDSGLVAAAERALKNQQKETLEVRFVSTFGKELWASLQLIPFWYAENLHLLVMFSSVAERRIAQAAQLELELRFRELAENIREVFWMIDLPKNNVLYVSPAYETVWGRSIASLLENPASWLEQIHPEDRARVQSEAERASGGIVYRIVRPDGSLRWIRDRAFPIRNSQGEIYRMAGIAEDITAHRVLEEQFQHAQKMEAIGHLAGGLAHDFNNLLTVITGYSEYLSSHCDLSPEALEMAKEIFVAGRRGANLTQQLLTFSRKREAELKPHDLNDIIRDVAKMLRRLIGEHIELKLQLSERPAPILADNGMIDQVLLNLAVNARDAMRNGGKLRLSTERLDLTAATDTTDGSARSGPFVLLTVKDTGCGMSPETLSRLFEPFFTTKEPGKGTGLGLASVFGIVKQHNGWIEVTSQLDCGAAFGIFLPALEIAAHPAAPAVEPSPLEGSETILLVEDDEAVRTLTSLVLQKLGYDVLEASDATQARAVWENDRDRIDLVLTDLIMPGALNGRQLAEQLCKDKPPLKVIYTSGYTRDVISGTNIEASEAFIRKPYKPRELAEAVRKCLDRA